MNVVVSFFLCHKQVICLLFLSPIQRIGHLSKEKKIAVKDRLNIWALFVLQALLQVPASVNLVI